jgi:hypothetical protein
MTRLLNDGWQLLSYLALLVSFSNVEHTDPVSYFTYNNFRVPNGSSAKALRPHVATIAMAKHIAAGWKLLDRDNEENELLSQKSERQLIVYELRFKQTSKSSVV